MVTWEHKVQSSKKRGEANLWTGRSDVTDWDGVSTDLVEFWKRTGERLALQSAASEPWKVILFMFRPDCGQINAQPANLPFTKHIDRESISLNFRFVKVQYFALPNPDDNQAFELAHNAMTDRFFAALQDSLLSPLAIDAISALRRVNPCRCFRVTYDDMETATEMQLPPDTN